MKKIILLFLVFGITFNLAAQKRINIDTLNIEQLNAYKDKAVKLKNTGRIVTFSGFGIVTIGLISSVIWMSGYEGESGEGFETLLPAAIGAAVGMPAAIAGISLWAIGGSRNAKAELALKKFDRKPDNSMVLGVGITLRF